MAAYGGAEIFVADLAKVMDRTAAKSAGVAAEYFVGRVRENLEGRDRTGRTYKDTRGVEYQASAPGLLPSQQYPTEVEGKLRESIGMKEDSVGSRSGYVVGSDLIYAGYLEGGTTFMVARQFLLQTQITESDTLREIQQEMIAATFKARTRNTSRGAKGSLYKKYLSESEARQVAQQTADEYRSQGKRAQQQQERVRGKWASDGRLPREDEGFKNINFQEETLWRYKKYFG